MQQQISFETLVDWVEGRLPESEAQAVAAQVTTDAYLQADVAWLRTFQRAAQHLVFEAPPPELRATLRRRFAAHAAANRPPTWRETLTAVLKFDSRQRPAGVGARSGATPEWQQLYTTDYADIALTIQPPSAEEGFTLFGQILPQTGDAPEAFQVQLFQAGRESRVARLLEEGEFVLEAVSGGDYELVLSSDPYRIVIPLNLPL